MKEIGGSIEIEAPAACVWGVLTDFPSYPEWNPWLTEMVGVLVAGSPFDATVRSPGGPAVRLATVAVRIDDGRELLFRGRAMRGLVTDDHLFTVEPLAPGRTRFSQRMVLGGPVIPLARGTVAALHRGLEAMNLALRERCEGRMAR